MSIKKKFIPNTSGFLKSWRLSEGASQKDFAARIGISPANLCDIEKGRKGISPERAYNIALKLGYPPEALVKIALQEQLGKLSSKYLIELKKVA